jgi:hypothetical protein
LACYGACVRPISFVERAARASFGHELFLDAFAAETVIRRANGNALDILAALHSPRHADRKALIVGAIEAKPR